MSNSGITLSVSSTTSGTSFFSQEAQLGEFSFGISQQLSYEDTINLNNVGLSVGLSVENFDFGVLYNFPVRNLEKIFSPSIFELYLTFDFRKLEETKEVCSNESIPIIIFNLEI